MSAKPSARRARWVDIAERLAKGVLAAWALLLLELVMIGVTSHRELASIWELQFGALWLAPVALAVSAVVGLAGGGLFFLIEQGDRRTPRFTLGVLAVLYGSAVGFGVGGGRHLAQLQQRLGFTGLVGLCAAALVVWLSPPTARRLRQSPLLVAAALSLTIIGLELANLLILPRLYPAFHLGLGALCLLLAPGVERALTAAISGTAVVPSSARTPASQRTPGPRWKWLVPLATLGACLLALGLARPFSERLSRFDNFRFLVTEQAPLLGRAVEIAARLSPPPPLMPDDGSCCAAEAGAAAGERALDLRGRDVLLVSIDALRADHVQSYGYERPTTPNLDRLAREGLIFERAYTATPHTSYAVTSLMTGKYMRPLLLQGSARDSDTWASLFRTYGYRTAAFYPPAVFFIDPPRFESFSRTLLGFEYAKVEFAEGALRIGQVRDYLARQGDSRPLFAWVHLFGPHEPYERHAEFDFGTRDVDRYDSEIAAADRTLGSIVDLVRARKPDTVVIVTADHGEEFEEHGGRYHGTTVYEEQVRVPLVISAPGAIAPGRVADVVQTIDVLPTLLSALDVPRPPRMRGRDLSPRIAGKAPPSPGLAHAETDEHTLLAEGKLRLICARRIGACRLYDLEVDPGQTRDATADSPQAAQALRARLREITASHGRYESQGLRAEGKGWPAALLRGIAGDADAASEIAELLDDVDPEIRRKAARVLFDLKPTGVAANLRLSLSRDEDAEVRNYAALTLTRLGEGAPLVLELLREPDLELRRLAALALGESGDKRAEAELIAWWRDRGTLDFTRAREVLGAFAAMRSKDSIPFVLAALDDVRLRPHVATTLAAIGDESVRYWLARALSNERSHSTRAVLLDALLKLGAKEELAAPLLRLLGVPDPPPNVVDAALRAKVLKHVGGPEPRDLLRLREQSELGVRVRVFIPKGGNGSGVRALVRASCPSGSGPGEVLLSSASHLVRYDTRGELVRQRGIPELDPRRVLRLQIPCTGQPLERFARIPDNVGAKPGVLTEFVVFANRRIHVEGLALVPLADELPPPPPEPWESAGPPRPG